MIKQVLSFTIAALLLAGCGGDKPGGNDTEHAPAGDAQATAAAASGVESSAADALDAAIAGAWRDPANVARDGWRNPKQTLEFFGVSPDECVLEIYPGGGWYSEILVPLLRENGHYIGAVIDPSTASNERAEAFYAEQNARLRAKFAENPDVFGEPELREIDWSAPSFGEPGSVDTVLTFRNVHNWLMAGSAEAMFKAFFDVLKPGGVLGVVEHRAAGDVDPSNRSGYVGQAQTIAFAEAAGFVLEEASEINANPADTKDHEAGVWSLPPTLRLGEKDRDKYLAIGESDRMTLRFRKPAE